ncbi:MobQ family relaxase [Piscinibacter koreensis]|uniref:MobA/MobL family protein n=1 Tax=Piscinibacter koreensis TaxID=2742824 RepID=A0A7Y6TZ83_9BURK|nr:MobQ family relaxase [Schlegelella koreensis]NUZ09064.1 MobA/MobL family protein [Schlegelella koreensis]
MFHLSVKPISRAAGRSATAAAAYRAGAEIVDHRTGEVHDYTRKSDIVHSEILVPPGAPAWAEDRTALWNAAEAAEKRKDARVARDYEVAIPKELTRAQGIELVRDFSQGLADRYGVAVDFNVHKDELKAWDGSEKGYQGYHAHILTSTRKLGRDGFGEKAAIELSDTKRKSLGLGDGAAEIEHIRRLWEVAANRHLEQANEAQRIDRRSLKDQGIDRDPTVHLGPHATGLERDGISSRLGDINRQVIAEAKERIENKRAVRELKDEIRLLEPTARKTSVARNSRTKPAVAAEVAPAASVDRGAEIARRSRERDERVRRVLAKAEQRRARREEAYRKLAQTRPQAPRGLLAVFQQKGHQAAMAGWERAKALGWKLAEQAKQLAQRLREVASPERVRQWAQTIAASANPLREARREPEQTSKARVVAAEALRERHLGSAAPGPSSQLSEQLLALKREWERTQPLRDKARRNEPLTLMEKWDVARAWDGLAQIMGAIGHDATPEQRQSVDKARLQAHRRVAAAVFLSLPRDEAIKQHPKLADAYTLLEAFDRKLKAEGVTLPQRQQVTERSRQRIATAIEQGKSIQVKGKEQPEPVRQVQRARDRGIER